MTVAAAYGTVTKPASHPSIERVERLLGNAKLDHRIVEQPLADARRALGRARAARDSGDQRHGALLDQLAVAWARMAHATVRAAKAEDLARIHASRRRELATKLERSRAMLTELQARRGRLQSEVQRAEQKARKRRQKAADAELRRLGRDPEERKGRKGKGSKRGRSKQGAAPRRERRGGTP